jgi:FAD/FMN-containing dehydrogenase
MTTDDAILKSLVDIVGEDFASNRPEELYMYARDSGTEGPRRVDYVAMPGTTEEVQRIVLLANEKTIPICPMGANLTLNGLGIPVHGGIVLDMKRMDRILEVNSTARYAVVEPGVTQGQLGAYLEKKYPHLEHSRPEAPPMATVVGNMMIRGHGYLSLRYGNNAHHINGMEVVLPTGEICTLGSGSVTPQWFAKGPLPDLTGLFCGWHGTTGVVTKLALKLFPKHRILDVVGIQVTDPELVPGLLYRITQTDMTDNLFAQGFMPPGADTAWPSFITISVTGDLQEEIDYKRAVFRRIVEEGGYEEGKVAFLDPLADLFRTRFVEDPPYVFPSLAADGRKGGGFRYCGAILPIDKYPEAWRGGVEIANRRNITFMYGVQVLGHCHSMNFCYVYTFNRAKEEEMAVVREAMKDSNELALELGGLPWKAEAAAQRQIVQKMDPNTVELMKRIRKVLDPKGIMNPGNWSDES